MWGPLELEPLKAMVADPLAFLGMECDRLRLGCVLIERIAPSAGSDRELTATILAFLRQQIPLHFRDEKEDLLPLMRHRVRRDDDVKTVLSRLSDGHAQLRTRIALVIPHLEERGQIAADVSLELVALASDIRQHLALLNAIILPIARLRFNRGDLDLLSQSMVLRRGLEPVDPGSTSI